MSLLYIEGLGIQRDVSEVYLSSDEHLGHANILRYAARPYDNIWHVNYPRLKSRPCCKTGPS